MRFTGYALLLLAAGCSSGTCRRIAGAAPEPVNRAPSAPSTPSATAPAVDDGAEERLLEAIEPLRHGRRTLLIDPPGDEEEPAFQAWIAAAARAARDGGVPPAAPAGFQITEVRGERVWLLAERKRRRGAGAVLLRVGPAAPLLVEAPHTFFDQGTLPLALSVFAAQRARALLINTAHRYAGGPRPEGGDEEAEGAGGSGGAGGGEGAGGSGGAGGTAAQRKLVPLPAQDVAHAERSFFLAAHRGLLEAFPGAPTAQIHGFQDRSAPDIAVIVSAVGPGADLAALLAGLREALPDDTVRGYPDEIRKLGGESNLQARASVLAGAPFYHLELSRSLRDRLVEDATLRRRVAAALSPRGAKPAP